ncbi:monocarboxylate transporter 12-B-like, partial [Oryzias melastigma]|uniref:monocarboxylate transporter 12-B-like n=1 Tax=Oryzias melastigma TaxID=30732 RepID=UPI00168CB89B
VREQTEGEESCGEVSSPDAELSIKPPKESEVILLPLTVPGEKPDPSPPKSRFSFSTTEYSFLLQPDFLGLAVSFLFLAGGCSLPFVYLVPYALSAGVSHQHAALLMSVLGVLDIVGNISFGWLTDRRCLKPHRLSCYILSVALEGLCCLFAPFLRSFRLLLPFAVLYGYFDGAYVALIPVVTSDVVGAKHLSLALGVVYFLHAIPYLISPPIGGLLVDITESYSGTFLLSGAALLASAFILSAVVGIRRCRRQMTIEHAPVPLSLSERSGSLNHLEPQMGGS